ncbi:dehydration-responsive element-binding protein 1F-like [Aristolochia californica]|uniref:dehydration-responsive element-binding protein 1F-like n=1 Tax=Aristolochia californica TaxID=171875 RepID=UPI0035DDE2E2
MGVEEVEEHSSLSSLFSDLPPTSTTSHKRRAGRKKFRETRHPFYRGVRQRPGGKWVCEVREPLKKSKIWLGTFPWPEMAARAHDVAAIALRGSGAALNFEDSRHVLPRPASSSSKDIQEAAAQAAEAFRPNKLSDAQPLVIDVLTHFHDEEAEYNMPSLLTSMAEGMLITPPSVHKGFDWDDLEDRQMDLSLWND